MSRPSPTHRSPPTTVVSNLLGFLSAGLDDAAIDLWRGGYGADFRRDALATRAELDHDDAFVTTFTVPAWAREEIVVTIVVATPEVPFVYAAWYPVTR